MCIFYSILLYDICGCSRRNCLKSDFQTDHPQTIMESEFPDIPKQSEMSDAPAGCHTVIEIKSVAKKAREI